MDELRNNKQINDQKRRELGLYIHVPFCVKKCDYCDFLSAPSNEPTKRRYFDALITEIRSYEGKTSEYKVPTIFFGGGTPSCVDASYIKEVIHVIREVFGVDAVQNNYEQKSPEITIEINPGTVDEEKLLAYKEAGINRLSFGLQTTKDSELKLLGRIHSFDQFINNYELARKIGFNNINIDLMSALPGQTIMSWEETLRRVADLKPEHISAYSLIIEEGTPFYDRYGEGAPQNEDLPEEETDREIYKLTAKILKEYGYQRYEISNYAQAGYECRHNLSYWIGIEYLGLGLGSSSLIKSIRFHNLTEIDEYIAACTIHNEEDSFSQQPQRHIENQDILLDSLGIRREIIVLSTKEQMEEFMFLGLRIMRGVGQEEFYRRFGVNLNTIYKEIIERHINNGLLYENGEYLCLTEHG
ncbi:MAG TPA: radical SAM family heme chaperone HemW, partial [Mobilitalea sp.]|nr:radical SAM family heme chaperone HemW [Mobilitalea sp.]